MDAKDNDIQENKKYSHIRIADGLSGVDTNLLRSILIKYDEDFKKMAREED